MEPHLCVCVDQSGGSLPQKPGCTQDNVGVPIKTQPDKLNIPITPCSF